VFRGGYLPSSEDIITEESGDARTFTALRFKTRRAGAHRGDKAGPLLGVAVNSELSVLAPAGVLWLAKNSEEPQYYDETEWNSQEP
jgi:hypothetical protein